MRIKETSWVCALLAAFAAAPLYAQHYQDLYDFNCNSGLHAVWHIDAGRQWQSLWN